MGLSTLTTISCGGEMATKEDFGTPSWHNTVRNLFISIQSPILHIYFWWDSLKYWNMVGFLE